MVKYPIYVPKVKAKEYGDLALNIYSGCPHGCTYCYGPKMLRRLSNDFHANVEPRSEIVESVRKALEKGYVRHTEDGITEKIELHDKVIHLCFTCDPYPEIIDSTPTRQIIELIKNSGNHVQILTKAGEIATRDFGLLDKNDWFGVTITGYHSEKYEPNAAPTAIRLDNLIKAKECGLNTWVSCEPVINQTDVIDLIREYHLFIDKIKIGKPNYVLGGVIDKNLAPMPWGAWGKQIEDICRAVGIDYYIKAGLREEIDK